MAGTRQFPIYLRQKREIMCDTTKLTIVGGPKGENDEAETAVNGLRYVENERTIECKNGDIHAVLVPKPGSRLDQALLLTSLDADVTQIAELGGING